jgi:hypothetical protein
MTRLLLYAICTLALVPMPAGAQSDRPKEDVPVREGLVAVYCQFFRDPSFQTRIAERPAPFVVLVVVNGTPRDTLSVDGGLECRDYGQLIPPRVENAEFLFGPKTVDLYGSLASGGVLRFDYVSFRDH